MAWCRTALSQCLMYWRYHSPDSKVYGANMGPIWGRQDPGGPHVVPMNFAIWEAFPLKHKLLLNQGQTMAWSKTVIFPLLMYWTCSSLAHSHQTSLCNVQKLSYTITFLTARPTQLLETSLQYLHCYASDISVLHKPLAESLWRIEPFLRNNLSDTKADKITQSKATISSPLLKHCRYHSLALSHRTRPYVVQNIS